MVNATSMEQEIRNVFKTELNTDLDIDLTQQCKQAVEASQAMENIQLKGVKGVNLNQKNFVENRCVLNSILNLDLIDKLSANVKDQLLSQVEQKSAIIPSANTSNTRQKAETIIENKVGLDAKVNLAKKCLQDLTANQSIKNIKVTDSMDINLTQDAVNYNKCIMDGAIEIAKGTGIDITKETETKAETKQTGFLASIGGLIGGFLGGPIISGISGLVICIVISVMVALIGNMGGKKNVASESEQGEGATAPPLESLTQEAKAPSTSSKTTPAKQNIFEQGLGLAQRVGEGVKTFQKVLGKTGGGKGDIVFFFLRPDVRIYVLIFLVFVLAMILFGKQNFTSKEIQYIEHMNDTSSNTSSNTPSKIEKHAPYNTGYKRKKLPYPKYDPMYF